MALFDRAFLEDPYAEFARLRADAPVLQYRSLSGRMWIATRHEHIRDVLGRREFLEYDLPTIIGQKRVVTANGVRDFAHVGRRLQRWLFFMSGADHQALRRAVIPLYATSAVSTAREAISAFVDEALTASATGLDHASALAWPLPAVATAALLRLPLAPDAVTGLASDVLKVFEPLQRLAVYEGIEAGTESLEGLLHALPTADRALEQLGEALGESGANLCAADLKALVIMLFAAGQDTVASAVSNAIHALAQDPCLLDQLREHPDLIPAAARELVRYDPPVQLIVRVAASDQTVGAETVRAGERICLALASANRDPDAFRDADAIQFDRPSGRSLSFGFGRHFCIGMHLTYLVLEVVLAKLAAGPRLRIMRAERRNSYVFRGFSSLVVAQAEGRRSVSPPSTMTVPAIDL